MGHRLIWYTCRAGRFERQPARLAGSPAACGSCAPTGPAGTTKNPANAGGVRFARFVRFYRIVNNWIHSPRSNAFCPATLSAASIASISAACSSAAISMLA